MLSNAIWRLLEFFEREKERLINKSEGIMQMSSQQEVNKEQTRATVIILWAMMAQRVTLIFL